VVKWAIFQFSPGLLQGFKFNVSGETLWANQNTIYNVDQIYLHCCYSNCTHQLSRFQWTFFRVQSQILTAADSWHHIRNFSYMTDMLSSSDKQNSSVWMVTSVSSVVNSWALNLDLLDRSATLGNPTHAPCEQSIPKKIHRISPVQTCGKSGKYMTGHMHTCAYMIAYVWVCYIIYTYLSCFSDWWESWLCFFKCCWYTVIVISSTWLVSLVLSQYSTPKSPCLMFIANAQLTTGW